MQARIELQKARFVSSGTAAIKDDSSCGKYSQLSAVAKFEKFDYHHNSQKTSVPAHVSIAARIPPVPAMHSADRHSISCQLETEAKFRTTMGLIRTRHKHGSEEKGTEPAT